jgi:transcriptional regulator with XRE-family HTH domain
MDEHTWHARLRRDRLARNWSQHELARQLINSSPIFHGHDEAILEGSIKTLGVRQDQAAPP